MQSEPTDSPRERVLAHIRAAFVLGLVVVCLIAAAPMPGPSTRKALQDAAGQAELQQWVDLFAAVGVQTDKDQLADVVMVFSKWARGTRKTLMDPFRPVFRITAAQQGWGLFAYPDTHPHSLVVEVRDEGERDWRTLYDSADPEHRWMADRIHYRRVRATYNPSIRPPSSYSGFVTWIARQAFDEDPDVQTVRVSLRRDRTLLPGEAPGEDKPRTRWRKIRHRPEPGPEL